MPHRILTPIQLPKLPIYEEPDRFLTSQEVSRQLHVHPRQVGHYVRAGLQAARVGKRLLFTQTAIDEFVRSKMI